MKISVVIPLYNKGETIKNAIESVFNQNIQPEELVIVNDGSTDESFRIVSDLKHPLIKLFNQPNEGVSSARNKGIKESKGEWIAFLDADDIWMPGFLEEIANLSKKHPNCSVLATSYQLQEYSGIRKNIILRKIPFKETEGVLTNYFEVASFSNPPLWTSATVVKKETIESIGCFPLNIHSGEDLLTWARIACISEIAYSISPQAVYVLNRPGNIDRRGCGPPKMDLVAQGLNELIITCKKHQKKYLKKYIARWHKNRASIIIRLTERKSNALRDILKSIKNDPFNLKIYAYLPLLFLPKILIKKIFSR